MHAHAHLRKSGNNCAVTINPARVRARRTAPVWLCALLLFTVTGCAWRPDPRFRSSPYEPAATPARFSGEQYGAMDAAVAERFKEQIRLLWQAPYQWGGNSHQGIDCSGLIVKIYREAADVDLPRTTRELYHSGAEVDDADPLQFADLVFFSLRQRGTPDHVGLYVAHGYFIHASASAGVRLSKIYDQPFNTHFIGARRLFN